MLLRLFKGTSPGIILLIIITLGASWISVLLHPHMPGMYIYETEPMPLYGVIKFLTGNNPIPGLIFSSLCFCLMLFLLVNFNTSVFFINERTFLPALFYLLLIAVFPQCQVLNPVLPASVFLILAIRRIVDTYHKPGIVYDFFDAGILISIGSMFYANLIWFGVLVIIGVFLMRTGNIKEIIISLLGLATPYVLTAGLYYVSGKDIGIFLLSVRDNLFERAPEYVFSRLTVIVLIFTGLMLLVSIGFLLMRMNSKKIKSRKTFTLLLWSFVISLVLYFSVPSISIEIIWIAGIPAGYFLAHYFIFERKKLFGEIVFSLFILLAALIQIFDIV